MSRRGEFSLIGKIDGLFPLKDWGGTGGLVGIGDDCAVIPRGDGRDTLVSTDLLIEGVHFLLERAPGRHGGPSCISPFDLGWKSAAVNISDVAAMGGRPSATFLSIAVPDHIDDAFLDEFLRGYREISLKYGVPLLGGDTTSSKDSLCINVAVMGECPSGGAVLRSGALPGDLVCVTGNLGDSAAGLDFLLRPDGVSRIPSEYAEYLAQRHFRPEPRVREGLSLAACGSVGAMMDISDGIASDLRHILKASSAVCGTALAAEIDTASLPLSKTLSAFCDTFGLDPLDFALSGGEDYELLFTCRPLADIPVPHTVIGNIREAAPADGNHISWLGTGKDFQGFRHF
ncbi:MAG: thiamine-phosphate kinase [Bacteroidales bacterium]|nr:thiamine-phosphate kinase [Bacteroidales bacterium]